MRVLNLVPADGSWVSFADLTRKAENQHVSKPTLIKHLKQLVGIREVLTKRQPGEKAAGRRGPAPWRFYRRNIRKPAEISVLRELGATETERAYWTHAHLKGYTELRIAYLDLFLRAIDTLLDASERSRNPSHLRLVTEQLADIRLKPALYEIARVQFPICHPSAGVRNQRLEERDDLIIYQLYLDFQDELEKASEEWRRRYCPKWARKYRQELGHYPVDLALSIIGESKQDAREQLESFLAQLHRLDEDVDKARAYAESPEFQARFESPKPQEKGISERALLRLWRLSQEA